MVEEFKGVLEFHRIFPNKYGLGWTSTERHNWQVDIGQEIFEYLEKINKNLKVEIKVYIDEMTDKEVHDNYL